MFLSVLVGKMSYFTIKEASCALHMYYMKGAHSRVIIHLGGWSVPVFNLGCSSLLGSGSMAMWNVSYWMFCITALWSMKLFVPAAWCQTCFNPDMASYTEEQSKRRQKPSTNVLLYILSHSVAEAAFVYSRPSFKGAEHPLRAWKGAD